MESKIKQIEGTYSFSKVFKDFNGSSPEDFMETLVIMLLSTRGYYDYYSYDYIDEGKFLKMLINNVPIIDVEKKLNFNDYITEYLKFRNVEVVNDFIHSCCDDYGEELQELIFKCEQEFYKVTFYKTSSDGFLIEDRGEDILGTLSRVKQVSTYETIWE